MEGTAGIPRKPDWLKVKLVQSAGTENVRHVLRSRNVRTVCDSSRCPNIGDCWGHGTATFLILGEVCTRACRFCAVRSGDPCGALDEEEPTRVAQAVFDLGLRHVVITSVSRDDLDDGGAEMFASTVREVRARNPKTTIELLVPDFNCDPASLEAVSSSHPEVIGHNLEVVRSLQQLARDPRASYERSLMVLRRLKEISPATMIKTSLMLGLGETREEVLQALKDARQSRVDLLALGQYLRPRDGTLPVARYVSPFEFAEIRSQALGLGFAKVMAGPLVRSSFHAHEMLSEEDGGC